jgi:hypothetical protein
MLKPHAQIRSCGPEILPIWAITVVEVAQWLPIFAQAKFSSWSLPASRRPYPCRPTRITRFQVKSHVPYLFHGIYYTEEAAYLRPCIDASVRVSAFTLSLLS